MWKFIFVLLLVSHVSNCENESGKNNRSDHSKKYSNILNNLSWNCANNASCVYSMARNIVTSYKGGDLLDFGLFSLEKLPQTKSSQNTARGSSGFMDFINGNAIRVPMGPMIFSVQRAEDDENYIELALLKKGSSNNEGRRRSEHEHEHEIGNRRNSRKEKKQLQMFIPMYLAATTFGWTLLAVKAVGLLTIKALAVSKLAFLVTVMVIIKKLMESAQEKMMMSHYPEQPFMMPYSMDYGIPAHSMPAAEMSNEFYPLHMQHQHPGGMEHLSAAESNLHPHSLDIHNSTQHQHQQQIMANGQQAKVKRDDSWNAYTKPTMPKNYQMQNHPVYAYRKF